MVRILSKIEEILSDKDELMVLTVLLQDIDFFVWTLFVSDRALNNFLQWGADEVTSFLF